jgi:ABC-type Fe3+/spermidine/putrescine transport system ATPase subunit
MLYITHDRGEAMGLADRIAVMTAGRFLQVAPPRLIYREPGSAAVAGMVGEGGTVAARMMGRTQDGRAPVSLLGYGATVRAPADRAPGAVTLVLRPEDLRLAERGETGFAAILKRTLYQGGRLDLEIAPVGQEGSPLWLSLPAAAAEPAPGTELRVRIADGWVLPAPAP